MFNISWSSSTISKYSIFLFHYYGGIFCKQSNHLSEIIMSVQTYDSNLSIFSSMIAFRFLYCSHCLSSDKCWSIGLQSISFILLRKSFRMSSFAGVAFPISWMSSRLVTSRNCRFLWFRGKNPSCLFAFCSLEIDSSCCCNSARSAKIFIKFILSFFDRLLPSLLHCWCSWWIVVSAVELGRCCRTVFGAEL